MGAMKDTAWEFCELIYPGDDAKQDDLFSVLCTFNPSTEKLPVVTAEAFREFFEKTHKWPKFGVEEMATVMEIERKKKVPSPRSNAINAIISAVETIANPNTTHPLDTSFAEQQKILAAESIYDVIRKALKEEIAKEMESRAYSCIWSCRAICPNCPSLSVSLSLS